MTAIRRRRWIFVGTLVLGTSALTYAAVNAALLPSTGHVTAGAESVTKCDNNGFVIDGFTLNGSGQITQIALSDIDATCVGGQLTVDLTRADEVSIGNGGPVTVTGSPMSVAITGLPDATLVKHEVVIIVGP
ncbi:MAG: hypothetical protein K1X87_07245 [Dehalococcoidia bacterium]|nr:hypothetical protein [Dehalococcoidia bacterium]